MTPLLVTVKNFYSYQKERFPLLILCCSFLPVILSSGVVTAGQATVGFVVSAMALSLLYLLHIRIIDEERDIDHDRIYHPDRPIVRGLISLRELAIINRIALVTLFAVALATNRTVVYIVCAMLIYAFLARHEFYLGTRLRRHFFIYNAVNLGQMILLQLCIYVVASEGNLMITQLLVYHFIFTTIGTIVFEFLRKVKVPGNDGIGSDTYTAHLGFTASLISYTVLLTLSIIFFVQSSLSLPNIPLLVTVGTGCVATVSYLTILLNYFSQTKRSNERMQLLFIMWYAYANWLLFFYL